MMCSLLYAVLFVYRVQCAYICKLSTYVDTSDVDKTLFERTTDHIQHMINANMTYCTALRYCDRY